MRQRSAGSAFPPAARFAITLALAATAIVLAPNAGFAANGDLASRLNSGAIEVGVAGSVVSTAGSTHGLVTLRSGMFFRGGPGLTGGEIALSYDHVNALDILDAEGAISWQPRLEGTTAFPFISLHGGIREEWIGSFSQWNVPVGASVGVRMLFGPHAGIRTEYSFRRLLRDPVANYNEHRALIGLSLFFRNRVR